MTADFTDDSGVGAVAAGATLIASWGGEFDNCYTTLTKANSFILATVVDYSQWDAASTTVKCAALVTATMDIDTRQYIGSPYFTPQSLLFPRRINQGVNVGLTWISSLSDELQVKQRNDVEKACAFQAVYIVTSPTRKNWQEARAMGIKQLFERTGPLADSVEFFSSGGQVTLSPDASRLLQAWMEGRRIVRG